MIADLQTVKRLLQITSASQDSIIREQMPIVQRQIVDYCNSRFIDNRVYLISSGISFVDASPATITDSESGFVNAKFYSGMDIFVSGSYNNNGFYEVYNVTAGTLTLSNNYSLISESGTDAVTIYKVSFPESLKMTFAKMINFNLQKNAMQGIKSESIADYSVTYVDVSGVDYPQTVVGGLKSFRRLKCR